VAVDDEFMGLTGARIRRSVSEKRRIVELTFLPGQSVARVAQAEGVNSHQVFQWRRAFKKGELIEPGCSALLPVVVPAVHESHDDERESEQEGPLSTGSIHIEFPGRVMISVERGADPVLLRSILESLRK
jgi:transposase